MVVHAEQSERPLAPVTVDMPSSQRDTIVPKQLGTRRNKSKVGQHGVFHKRRLVKLAS